MPLVTLSEVQTSATNERLDEVKKELIKKMKTIAQRTDAVNAFAAAHQKKVDSFEAAVAAATTPEEIETAIKAKEFSFNERYYPLYVKQD